MRFTTTVLLGGKTATGLEVPGAIEDAKKPETRAGRIERCVAKVTAG